MTDLPKRSRVIRAEQHEAAQWMPPDVHGHGEPDDGLSQKKSAAMPTAAQLEEITRQAHEEGYEEGRKAGFEYGHREGLEEGRQKVLEQTEQFDALLSKLERPFEALDEQVEEEVVALVIAMVRQLVRREVQTDPGQIVGVVREALGVLPVNARNIRVLLHPDDAVLVREAYAMGEAEQNWQIAEDPVIQRGGCRVYTENSQIDATLDSRLNSLIAPLLTSSRNSDEEAVAADDDAGT